MADNRIDRDLNAQGGSGADGAKRRLLDARVTRRGFLSMLGTIAGAGMLAGCTGKGGTGTGSAASDGSASARASFEGDTAAGPVDERLDAASLERIGGPTSYPFTFTTYDYNRQQVKVTIKKAPERVMAVQQNNIETLLALGLKDKIVMAYGLDDPSALGDLKADFDQIPFQDGKPSKEDVIGVDPDFITAWYSTFADDFLGDVDFWHNRETGTYMSRNSACRGKTGTYHQTIYDEFQDILLLGQIFDKQDEAQAIVDKMLAEVEKVQQYAKEQSSHPTVAVLENEDGSYRVYSEMTLGGNVATEAGATLAVGKGEDTANISAEDLIATDPDAVFMVWYDGFRDAESCVADITENSKFKSLGAVKDKKVFPVALTGIYCSGLHTIDGLRAFYQALYPDLQ